MIKHVSDIFNTKSVKKLMCVSLMLGSANCLSQTKIQPQLTQQADLTTQQGISKVIANSAYRFWNNYKFDRPRELKQYPKCQNTPNAQITFSVKEPPVTYDFTSKTSRQLTNISKKGKKNRKGYSAIGLTTWTVNTRAKLKHKTHLEQNNVCLYIEKIHVDYQTKQKVYVASEFNKNKCQKNSIKYHEDRHVYFNKMTMHGYASLTEKFYQTVLANIGGALITDPRDNGEQPYLVMQKKIENSMRDFYKNIIASSSIMHNTIDTKASYATEVKQMKKRCGGLLAHKKHSH